MSTCLPVSVWRNYAIISSLLLFCYLAVNPVVTLGQDTAVWPELPENEAGIVFRVLDAGQEEAVSASHLGVPTLQFTNADQSVEIRKPIDENGFVVFTAADLAAAMDDPAHGFTAINLIGATGQGQRIAGHVGFAYDYTDLVANKRLDAILYVFPGDEFAPSEQYRTGGGSVHWSYYRPNEMPTAMLVPPKETIRGFHENQRLPVLLLHDVEGSYPYWIDENQNGFITDLNKSHDVWQLYYPHNQEIEKSAAILGELLPALLDPSDFDASGTYGELEGNSVPVIAHGMGGLVARYYASQLHSSDVMISKLLMLGTPNHGSFSSYHVYYNKYKISKPVLNLLFGDYPDHSAPAYEQMTLSSKFLHELNAPSFPAMLRECTIYGAPFPYSCYLVIAGTKDQSEGAFTAIDGQQDGVVSVSSASLLSKAVPLITASLTHRELAYDTPVGLIKQFLKKWYTFKNLENLSYKYIDGYYSNLLMKEDENLLKAPQLGQLHFKLNGKKSIYNELSRIGGMVAEREDNVIRFEMGCASMFDRQKYDFLRRVRTPRVTSPENFFFSARSIGVNRIGTEVGFDFPEDDYEVVFYRRWFSNPGYACEEYTRITDPVPFRHLRTKMVEKDVNEAESVMLASNAFLPLENSASDQPQTKTYRFTVDPSIENLVVYFNSSRNDQSLGPDLKLVSPEGILFTSENSSEQGIEFHESIKGGFSYYHIKNPASGSWQVSYNGLLRDAFVSIPVLGSLPVDAAFIGEQFSVGEEVGFTVSVPAELISPSVEANLFREYESGELEMINTLSLQTNPEGILAGELLPDAPGIYTVQFKVRGVYQGHRVERQLSIFTQVNGRAIRDDGVDNMPEGFVLDHNFPNPFSATTTIRFRVQEASQVTLKIFDATGRLVNTLADQYVEAGVHERTWDGRLVSGAGAPSGIYFYTLESQATQHRTTRSMLLIK